MTENSMNFDITDIQKKIAAGQFDAALDDLQPMLQLQEPHADANYMAAVCCRYTNSFDQAQKHLNAIKDLAADKGRVYQEQGYLYRARKQMPQALAAFQTACQMNPALISSWQNQAELHQLQGNAMACQQAIAQIQRLHALPKTLVSVTDLIAQGKLVKAEALCKKFLQQNATHPEAMRLLADIAMQLGAMEEAEFLLDSASTFAPDNSQIRIDHIAVLRRRQKFEASLKAAEALYRSDPQNPQFQSVYAIEKMQIGDYAEAVAMFNRVLERIPHDALTHTGKGHALKTWGKQSEAIESYRAAIAHKPDHGEAYYSLSNLKTYEFSDDEVQAMLELVERDSVTSAGRVYIHFALGKAFEDRQDWSRSFAYYQEGNRYKKQQSRYTAEQMTEELLSQRAFFSGETIKRLAASGCPDPAPIFIVGLPRAGSTLLEQILSSHSMVDGTLELPNMLSIAQKLRRKGHGQEGAGKYPDLIGSLPPEELHKLGQQYIDETRIHRGSAPYFIDKMPNNFRHIGLIKAILPNAKIIDARRHPIACCFSGFKQLFAEGQEFSYSLDDIARYYNDYVTLMDYWDEVIPGAVLKVCYEEVTVDLENQVKRILDYCELPFERSCLEFYKTERAVRTASSEQVRQPIYQTGVNQWRSFEPWLGPLKQALTPALESYPTPENPEGQ